MQDLPLFAYGTLQDRDILAATLGRPVEAGSLQPASADGYVAVFYPSRVYPALVAQADGAAPGHVLTGVSTQDWAVLDAFEGDEYQRAIITVRSQGEAIAAYAYLPSIVIAPTAAPWSLALWERLHKAEVLGDETAVAAEIRARLAARQVG